MRLLIKDSEYELFEFDSESEQKEYVDVNDGIFLMGNCNENKKRFYGLYTNSNFFEFVGIAGGIHGIIPTILHPSDSDSIFISVDEIVYFIDLNLLKIIGTHAFESIIYTLILDQTNSVIIVCELGVHKMSTDGKLIWKHTSDVIKDFQLKDSHLKICTDESEYLISIESGKKINF